MKIERLLAITIMLLNRRRVRANELAEHFDVSVRTVYRDIETLNGAGIPVVSYQGYEGGFCIPDNYKLSRQLLTFDDMLSILTTLKGVNRTLQNSDIERAIEKIRSIIPKEKEEIYRTHSDSFIVDITPWHTGDRLQKTLQHIHGAVSESTTVAFDYSDSNGKISHRLVEPHTLIYKSFTWYLLAHCRLRDDFRLFRLSRIRSLQPKKEHFLRRKVDPLSWFTDMESRQVVELILRFGSKVRVKIEDQFDEFQLQHNPDGSTIATLSIPEDDWIYSFILSFGTDVEVLSPSRWRDAIDKKCTEMGRLYRNEQ